MREWAQWITPTAPHNGEDTFFEWVTALKGTGAEHPPPQNVLRQLQKMFAKSVTITGVEDSVERLVREFLNGAYVAAYVRKRC